MKIGIIGGGQLAMMMIQESNKFQKANSLDLHEFHIYDERPSSAAHLGTFYKGKFDEIGESEISKRFLKSVDVVTYEFENIPARNLSLLENQNKLVPNSKALEISQSRLREKEFFKSCGLKVGDFHRVNSNTIGSLSSLNVGDYFLKTNTLGYDGKGQVRVENYEELLAGFSSLNEVECILETRIPFENEFSICGTRTKNGEIVFYPLSFNIHEKGILNTSMPAIAKFSDERVESLSNEAQKMFLNIVEKLNYIGTLCLELFQVGNELYLNEMAPRVHNSTHWTIESCRGNQFLNHILAITDQRLESGDLISPHIMFNVLGTKTKLDLRGVGVFHDYRKSPRKGRKLAHISISCENSKLISDIENQLKKSNEF